MLRIFQNQSVDFSKQLVELVWQQSQTKSSFPNPPTKCKTTDWNDKTTGCFSTSLKNTLFSKDLD